MSSKKLRLLARGIGLVAVLGGVAYAGIPASNGVISACKDNKGALRVIDAEAGQSCNANQQPLTWNQQGPPGPQGPAGTARAYAQIGFAGNVQGGNLTSANVVKGGPGEYCFGNLGFTPATAV